MVPKMLGAQDAPLLNCSQEWVRRRREQTAPPWSCHVVITGERSGTIRSRRDKLRYRVRPLGDSGALTLDTGLNEAQTCPHLPMRPVST